MDQQQPHAEPVTAGERVASLDVVRAVALMGIFVMNLPTFAFTPAAFFNPNYSGTFFGADQIVWMISHILFEQKMMAIFSMLFGAGVLLMTSRAKAKGDKPFKLHLRRMFWLFLIGMAHAYLIWEGDILVGYALCGLIVFPMRKLSPKPLAIIGAVVLAFAVPLGSMQGAGMLYVRSIAHDATLHENEGKELTDKERGMLEAWEGMQHDFSPNTEHLEQAEKTFTGSYAERFVARAPDALMMQTFVLFFWTLWRATGLMLIGMALYKWGFLTGAWDARRYLLTAGLGYVVGLPIVVLGMVRTQASGFDFIDTFIVNGIFNYLASVPVAIAHASVIMALLKSRLAARLAALLSPYGRMALTNYLGQSLIAALLFYGYGFGLWGTMDRVGLVGVMLAVWTAQIIFSHLWLGAFRFGPAEWAWRSLTYMAIQPLRKR